MKASRKLQELICGRAPGSDLDKMLQYTARGGAAEGGEWLREFFIKAFVVQQLSAPTCDKWMKNEGKWVAVTIVTEDSRAAELMVN